MFLPLANARKIANFSATRRLDCKNPKLRLDQLSIRLDTASSIGVDVEERETLHATSPRGNVSGPSPDQEAPEVRPNKHGRRHWEHRSSRGSKASMYLDFSPTQALAVTVDVFIHCNPLTPWKRKLLGDVAASSSLRLSVLTAQYIMRIKERHRTLLLSTFLPEQTQWDHRLEHVAHKGIPEEYIAHWAWILTAGTGDSMVQRFISSSTHKPIFLLLLLLDSSNSFRIRRRESLAALLDYISVNYISTAVPRQQHALTNRSLEHALNMTPFHFAHLLSKLVDRAREIWPATLVTIANLAASFIGSIPPKVVTPSGYIKDRRAARCLVLNRALELFERPQQSNPMRLSKYNWEAQKVLLALANRVEPHAIINRSGYRAIRRVLIRLRKSPSERTVAERYAKTWPPYRTNWDGIDEQRRPEDDLSRSAKAGIFMLEAGYIEQDYDRALTALGGGRVSKPPTVQTRALSPVLWSGSDASRNIFSAWASELRATRNAQEAWRIFNSPPSPYLAPNIQVYAAMFEKLLAREVTSPSVLPGETTRETFPIHDTNLSAFEKARLQPPSIHDLYNRMRESNIRPVGSCLTQLIVHADTIERAVEYLKDSPFWENAAALVRRTQTNASVKQLRQLPLAIFNAWISLLCRLDEREPGQQRMSSNVKAEHDYYVLRAFALCRLVLSGRVYSPPWHSLLAALAGPKFRSLRRTNRLATFLRVLNWADSCVGADPVLLEKLALFLQKYLQFLTDVQMKINPRMRHEVAMLDSARKILLRLFKEVTKSAPAANSLDMPPLYHDIGPSHLYRYIRALASFGDSDEMVRAVRWILQAWEHEGWLEEAKIPQHPDHRFLETILSHFNNVGDRLVRPELMRAVREEARCLVEERGSTWVMLRPGLVDEGTPLDAIIAGRWAALQKELGYPKDETSEMQIDTPSITCADVP